MNITKPANISRYFKVLSIVFVALTVAACSTGPKVRSDKAANVDFSQYQSFAFVSELATDRAGYTTLVTQHFKDAISAELTARGYRYDESNPQLLVNFNSNVASRSETRSIPTTNIHYGYYHYRRGIVFAGFPVYSTDVSTVHYKVGTVNIDLVDNEKRQLIWEGIAEGSLKQRDLEQPREAAARTVATIFEQFPLPTR